MLVVQVSQHRDVIQTEYARVNVAKGKLENLCRELQKHSKAVAVSCWRVVCLLCANAVWLCAGGEQAAAT